MLKERFLNLLGKYSDDPAYGITCWEEIDKNYSSESRYYHSTAHLKHMLLELKDVELEICEIDTLLFSIYYHDIVYVASNPDNEHQSAMLFSQRISPTRFHNIEKCIEQINATKWHRMSEDMDTNILMDLDLSILGTDYLAYGFYYHNIRKEYFMYPDQIYYEGRKKVLKRFLSLPSIFKTRHFIGKFEEKARLNIESELKQLQ